VSINNCAGVKFYESKIGSYKGVTPRITLETKRLANTAFTPGAKIDITFKKNKIIITISNDGERQITSRRGKQVLDIKSMEIANAIKAVQFVKVKVSNAIIEITPLKEALEQNRAKNKVRTNKRTYNIVDIFCSGGTLAKCFDDNKKFNILAGIDHNDKKLETYQLNFPFAETWCGDIANVEWERYKDAAIVTATPSCRPYTSLNQTGKKNGAIKESAPEGDNTAQLVQGINEIRPALFMLEEVPEYVNSYSYLILKSVLLKMGYFITEKILAGQDFGALSPRKRLCLIASIKEGFTFLPIQPSLKKRVKDILEVPFKLRNWRRFENFERWSASQVQKGRNFTMCTVDENATKVAHPTTRYYGRQYSTILKNKDHGNDFFSPRELARIAELPDNYQLPTNQNDAAFIIGDGVVYSAFSYVAKCIEEHLKMK